MNGPLDILRSEHEVILRACETALDIARSLKRDEPVPHSALASMCLFFEDYVEERHDRIERDLLYPVAQRRTGYQTLPQYEEGRWWIRSLDQIAKAHGNGCPQAGMRWADTVTSYVGVLRERIEAEELSIFPRIESALNEQGARELRERLEAMERAFEAAA
jgi:hemerythrin-like domain-containing protein